ncbi:restriction endonuclease subunit S [Desulfofundulus thermocisternus]|uniref:restriction endonuclease subunit S n=1 Tax=Desulfofundulus thermocisternus TaxID=42471 RepID=UPI00217D9490|nr:restriction endonuclease subunit S [Desulfofundulus thermocisternus]MCS5696953.1 restriction endonuclease subunit S [Desulfofundulus thermocisternus]
MSEVVSVPSGWVKTTLGEVYFNKSTGVVPSRTPNKLFELYSVPSFSSGYPEIVLGQNIGSNKQTVCPGAVLVCKINPRINRIWVVGDYTNNDKIASTEWIVFWPIEGVVPKYLCYYMQQNVFRDFLASHASGVGGSLMRVKPETFADYPFLLPPTNEQRRIVAKIEELFSHLDAGVAALERAKANLKRYRAAVLKAAVEGKLTAEWRARHPDVEPASELLKRILAERRRKWEEEQLAKYAAKGKTPPKNWKDKYREPAKPDIDNLPRLPEGWCWATVEQIGMLGEQPVLTGPFGTTLGRSDFVSSGVPLLTIGCLTESGLSLDKALYITEDKARQLSRYRVRLGDLLFSRSASIGRVGYVTSECQGAVINYHLMRLRLASSAINPLYFYFFVQGSTVVTDYLREVNHGATRDGINTKELLRLPVAIPSMKEQEVIINELERQLSSIRNTVFQVEACLRRILRLRQAILKRAFEGKLVPQDPNDEPASVLLERIREERRLSEGTKAKRAARKVKARKSKGVKAS